MLGKIKKKLSNALQEGMIITESIQQQYRQHVSKSTPSTPETPTRTIFSLSNSFTSSRRSSTNLSQIDLCVSPQLNVAAGCNLLAKYEDDWQKIHASNEENALHAEQISKHISDIEKRARAQNTLVMEFYACIGGIPKLVEQLNTSLETLKKVETLVQKVEEELEHLVDLCEECDLQELILGKQFELSRHKQKKMNELEIYRQRVAEQHNDRIRQHEEHLKHIQRERQAVFDDAFRGDLEEFKQKGALPIIQKELSNKLVLEEIVLDDNVDTKDALEEFLNS